MILCFKLNKMEQNGGVEPRIFYGKEKMPSELKKYEVNGTHVWVGKLYKVNNIKQERPINFYIRPLNKGDSEQMGKLSESIYHYLKNGEECFIHKHTKEYFYEVFDNPKIRYIGVFVGKNLVGMSYIRICENKKDLQEELPNCEYNFYHHRRNGGENKVASMGGDSVLPLYRGNALNTIMINYRIEQAQRLGCTDCTSIVDRKNRWNMAPYFSCNFNLFSTAIDPSDGGKISLLHKPMDKESVLSCFKPRISIPYERLEVIDYMISKGFVGIDFDKEKGAVLFAHTQYYNQQNYHAHKNYQIIDIKRRFAKAL